MKLTTIKAATRPAKILSDEFDIDREMKSARYIYHRLLDFEDEHQKVLDDAAEQCAPGFNRVSKLVACLQGRQKRAARSTGWAPNPHPKWLAILRSRLNVLKKQRNKNQRWKAALKWADEPGPNAPDRGKARRRLRESDEDFTKRCASRRNKATRREEYRLKLYTEHCSKKATARSRIHFGTWNGLLAAADQARKSVIKVRASGLPAQIRRPRWDDDSTIYAGQKGFRIINTGGGTIISKNGVTVGNPWWTIEMRISNGWVRFKAKLGNWHEIPIDAQMRTAKLTRRKNGNKWSYSISISIKGMPAPKKIENNEIVALDWGHREHGHPAEKLGIRVFTWRGNDGDTGEILLPIECRELLDSIDSMKSRVDKAFLARKETLKLKHHNRYGYRKSLLRAGVRSKEECLWLQWEMKYERRMMRARKRIDNLRKNVYITSIHTLREKYSMFAIEDESIIKHRKNDKEESKKHRKRSNRELSARYLFTQLCERSGATMIPVPSRNSTRECPFCGHLSENTSELEIVCESCGFVRDKDYGACEIILRRAKEVLANQAA